MTHVMMKNQGTRTATIKYRYSYSSADVSTFADEKKTLSTAEPAELHYLSTVSASALIKRG